MKLKNSIDGDLILYFKKKDVESFYRIFSAVKEDIVEEWEAYYLLNVDTYKATFAHMLEEPEKYEANGFFLMSGDQLKRFLKTLSYVAEYQGEIFDDIDNDEFMTKLARCFVKAKETSYLYKTAPWVHNWCYESD